MPGWNALSEVYLDEFGDTPALDRPKMLALIITDGEAKDMDAFAAEMAKVGKSAYIVICIMGFGEEHDRALAVYQKVAEANDHVRVVTFGNSSDPNPQLPAGDELSSGRDDPGDVKAPGCVDHERSELPVVLGRGDRGSGREGRRADPCRACPGL
jgi:hypothetical protein